MVRFIWNKDQTACVRAKKIRTITLKPLNNGKCGVMAWFNSTKSFFLGEFDNEAEAKTFVRDGLN